MKKTLLSMAVISAFCVSPAIAAEIQGFFTNGYQFDNEAEKWTVLNTGTKQGVGHTGVDVKAQEIEINSTGNGVSVYGDVTLTAKSDITINSAKNALFLAPDSNSDKQKLTVNAGGNLVINGTGYGIHGERGSLEINAANVSVSTTNGITANGSSSLVVNSSGSIDIAVDNYHGVIALGSGASVKLVAEEDISIINTGTASSASAVRTGAGDISISAGGSTVVKGNIRAGGVGNIDVGFSGEDSLLEGAVLTESTGKTTLQFTDGATWVATGASEVSNLTVNDSTIDMSGISDDINVENFAGSSATIIMSVENENAFNTESAEQGSSVVVMAKETADEISELQAEALVSRVSSNVATTGYVAEGMYNGAMTVDAGGVVATATNSIMSNVLDLVSASTFSMNRIMMNDVRKRMGDLRASEGTYGVWARYDGGKLSGSNSLENDFTTIQVGIDTVPVADAPRFGVAFAYTKSEADMKRGDSEMDAFSLAFYGTKMYDNGMFVDVIGRMATADTDVMVDGDKKGSMDSVALSLSGEFGWRFDVTDKFYFEPQAELTYTYVNADKLTLSNGSSYDFDAVDSLLGRVGFAAGFKCPDNFGDVYVRASAVHEFLGDAAVIGGNGTIHEVDGEDTWVEFGIGANFNINKNAYVYVDVERTEGADLDEDWRANVGVRYTF